MDKAKAFVKKVGQQCVVEARDDAAGDVRSALEGAGLKCSPAMPITGRLNVSQFLVTTPDGATISTQNIRILLGAQSDIVVEDI